MSDTRLAAVATNAATSAVTRLLNGGRLEIYDGTRPAIPNARPLPSSTRLSALALADPAFHPPTDGRAVAHPISSARALGTGRASWFRLVTRDGVPVYDGTVGDEDSRADLRLGSVAIQTGMEILIAEVVYKTPTDELAR